MRSVDEWSPGEYVGFRKEETGYQIAYGDIVKVVAFTDLPKERQEIWKRYEDTKQYIWIWSEVTKRYNGISPDRFYTAEETEEILYHCSYCGVEGHNRRTCPKLEATSTSKEEYFVGGIVDDKEISFEGLFTVEGPYAEYSNIIFERTTDHTYVEGKIVASIPGGDTSKAGGVGNKIRFPKNHYDWKFRSVTKDVAIPDFKPLSLWDLIETVLPASRLTLLYGPPGTGKTTIANSFGTPNYVSNITLTEETPAAELRGHFIPRGGEFIWMDGPALTEFKRGGRLVLNEIDKASGDALTFCHALLDDPGIARITLPFKDEDGHPVTISPHEDFHVVATMNGEPEDLPEALRDRFAVRIHVDKVHPNAIKALPNDLRKIASKGVSNDQERSVSIRGWNAFVALREAIGEDNAAQAVFGPRAKTILNTIKIDAMAAKSKEKK